jgi:hypothetical protein
MTTITGFQEDTDGAWIYKDSNARLTYTMDWVDWLPPNTALSTVVYTHNSRANDADPVVLHSTGISTTKTFVNLSGGTVNRVYVITAEITLDNGSIDRRHFRIKISNRSA